MSSEGIKSFQYQKHFLALSYNGQKCTYLVCDIHTNAYFSGIFDLGHFVIALVQSVFMKKDSYLMVKYNDTYLVVSRHKQKKIRNTIIEAAMTIASFFLVPCGTLLGNSSSYESQIIATVVYLTIHYSCNNRLSLESWVQCFKSEWSFSEKYVQTWAG